MTKIKISLQSYGNEHYSFDGDYNIWSEVSNVSIKGKLFYTYDMRLSGRDIIVFSNYPESKTIEVEKFEDLLSVK